MAFNITFVSIIEFMKLPSRLNWLRVLMITAQLMLTGLVVQWLMMQYREQEHLLKQRIETVYVETQRQAEDSALYKNYIGPIIDSSRRIRFNIAIIDTTSSNPNSFSKNQSHTSFSPDKIKLSFFNDSDAKRMGFAQAKPGSGLSNEFLLRGVRMLVKQAYDSSSGFPYYSGLQTSSFDTTTFNAIFITRIDSVSPHLQVYVTDKPSAGKQNQTKTAISYTMGQGKDAYKVSVEGSQMVILRALIQPMAFAVFLLLITGAAFVIAFRSLKAQMLLNSLRDDFVRNMSHELKTPVATVKVALEALQNFNRKDDPEKLVEYLGMASQEINRLELLIDRAIGASNFSGTKGLITVQKVNLKELTEEVIRLFQPVTARENATVNFSSELDLPVITGDKLQLQGVLTNLIDNAMKYAGPNPQIDIHIIRQSGNYVLTVADRGPGIPEQYRKRVFDKFFRIPTGDVHTVKGHGLGLTYAAMVVRLHKGSLALTGREGGGCVFTLTLPDNHDS
ncbi:MAG: HAMP domain-containing histidine kinase [Lentimicrobiaceae bacterium]|nr:HAMP domain-containing histidine kinase [Lentimicrobiaceae bacterium]